MACALFLALSNSPISPVTLYGRFKCILFMTLPCELLTLHCDWVIAMAHCLLHQHEASQWRNPQWVPNVRRDEPLCTLHMPLLVWVYCAALHVPCVICRTAVALPGYRQRCLCRTMQEQRSRAAPEAGPPLMRLLERSVLSDRMVFVRASRAAGWMSQLEMDAYDYWFEPMVQALPAVLPDGFVYLRASAATCHHRLTQRSREEEASVREVLNESHTPVIRRKMIIATLCTSAACQSGVSCSEMSRQAAASD